MADETRRLAKFAADLSYDQIPAHVRARLTDLIVDQIGVEIGCSEMPWAKQVRDTYRGAGGVPEATVVRYGDRIPAASAAFINSTFGHSFEYDEGNPLIHGHLGSELVPSLLAISERDHLSGRDFLAAFIAAYEVRGRIAWAVSPDMVEHGGPQYSTSCGPFGVAAGVAKLLGLGAEGIRNALGIAGGFSGGLMQYDQGGGSVKRIYTAIAASSGIQAAHLARAGITGPEEILEGRRGLLRIYASKFRPERLIPEVEKRWMIETMYFKPYCCVGIIAAAIDGLRKVITDNALKAENIESVEVGYPKGYPGHAGGTAPHDILGMQFSTSYSLALTVLKGGNTPREYAIEALTDPKIRAFSSKVRVVEDTELTRLYEGKLPARVKVRTTRGISYEALVIEAKGSPGNPLTRDEVDAKFHAQVEAVFGAQRCQELIKTLRNTETLDDMAELSAMLV